MVFDTIASALWILGVALGATFVAYPIATLLGGGGRQGEENEVHGELLVGFVLLIWLLL